MGNALDYSNWKEEKIEGKIYYMSPVANPKHGLIISNLQGIFYNYLKGKKCKSFSDTIAIYFDEESNNYVVPDISILCDASKFKENGYHGIPSLIVEVISPSNIKRDKIDKFNLYEKFGVQEFWLIDYRSETIEQYTLINGLYQIKSIITTLSSFEYDNLSDLERENYTSFVRPTIFNDLEIDIKEIFE